MSHPAPFSEEVIAVLVMTLIGSENVLDPFAGVGGIHQVAAVLGIPSKGVEIEPEWANLHPDTILGNALCLPWEDGEFDAICTSPCYGNRMADHHNAKDGSYRRTYKHALGRNLHPENSGMMQWGQDYMDFHQRAYKEIVRCLRPGGKFVLNVSDHIRKGNLVPVSDFHVDTLANLGVYEQSRLPVKTKRFRRGRNHEKRAQNEWVIVLRKD